MGIIRAFKNHTPNYQVYDLFEDCKRRFLNGDYGAGTKCLVIVENPDGDKPVVIYDTCGVHLSEAVGILEIAKKLIMKDV